jgi:hypothetical protein
MIITDEQLTTWLKRLVNIPSVTPEQAGPRAGAPGEARLAAAVAGWFRDFGGEVSTEDVLPGRPNVYGIWRGTSQRWAALDVHMDTVGVEQMSGDPFGGERRGCGLGPGTYAARVASPRLVRAPLGHLGGVQPMPPEQRAAPDIATWVGIILFQQDAPFCDRQGRACGWVGCGGHARLLAPCSKRISGNHLSHCILAHRASGCCEGRHNPNKHSSSLCFWQP